MCRQLKVTTWSLWQYGTNVELHVSDVRMGISLGDIITYDLPTTNEIV